MFKYEYVQIDNEALIASKFTKHRDIIDEYAKRGYRYAGFVPIKSDGYGRIKEMDLIFEKEVI